MIVIYNKNTKQYLRNIGGSKLAPIAYQIDIDSLADNEGYLALHNINDAEKVNKINDNYPFDLVFDGDQAIDIVFYDKPIIPPTEEEINEQVRDKIDERYDYAQEIQMLNKGLLNANDTEYLEYKAYRQECIDWGIAEKQKYGYI